MRRQPPGPTLGADEPDSPRARARPQGRGFSDRPRVMDNFCYYLRVCGGQDLFHVLPLITECPRPTTCGAPDPDVKLQPDGTRSVNDAFRDEIEELLDLWLPKLVSPEKLITSLRARSTSTTTGGRPPSACGARRRAADGTRVSRRDLNRRVSPSFRADFGNRNPCSDCLDKESFWLRMRVRAADIVQRLCVSVGPARSGKGDRHEVASLRKDRFCRLAWHPQGHGLPVLRHHHAAGRSQRRAVARGGPLQPLQINEESTPESQLWVLMSRSAGARARVQG